MEGVINLYISGLNKSNISSSDLTATHPATIAPPEDPENMVGMHLASIKALTTPKWKKARPAPLERHSAVFPYDFKALCKNLNFNIGVTEALFESKNFRVEFKIELI